MTIQQWLFSFKGRIGRRDFWIWIGLWFAGMLVLFSLAGKNFTRYSDRGVFALCACFGQQRQ
ncbi:Putative membrane protein [Escherichia coli ISC41]|nr:Putative membrane protein [Escherichia coli ISC41]